MAFLVTSPPSAALPWASLINDEVTNVVICTPVYSDGAGTFKMALGDGSAKAKPIGLVVDPSVKPGASGNVLATGMVTATTAQWDAVAGTSGGLAAGVTYYLSASVAGALTTNSASGVAVIEGLSATTAKIVIGNGSSGSAQPTISLTNASGVLCVAGTPVYVSAAGSFSKAVATSASTALVVGLLTADCAIGATGVIQKTNAIPLATAQWDAITGGSGGLSFGKIYYLDLTAGKLVIETGSVPSTPGQFLTFVGSALSATQMGLGIQPPIGL